MDFNKMRDIPETKSISEPGYKEIKPIKELSQNELLNGIKREIEKEKEFKRKYDLVKSNDGEWTGEVGNSTFIPNKLEAKEALAKYELSGIEYKNMEPDFSKVSEITLQIDDMTSFRPYNFKQADQKCRDIWNSENKFGKSDWTVSDVRQWRQDHKCTWHERSDMKTMDLVPTDIHSECRHFGGVHECRKVENSNGGGFDE